MWGGAHCVTNDSDLEFEAVPLDRRPEVLINSALERGSMPDSVRELLALTRRDDAKVGPVAEALARNPALVVAVFRAANGASNAQSRKVTDLHRAVVVLGMQELHDLVAGVSMMGAFSSPDPLSQQLQAAAVLSGTVALHVSALLGGIPGPTAFLAGLLSELGALACLGADPSFAELYKSSALPSQDRYERERGRYGIVTPALGGEILAASKLPADVVQAVSSTGLEGPDKGPALGRVVAFARFAAPALLRTIEHADGARLRTELLEAATLVRLDEIDPDTLFAACLAAAETAELGLRGELRLVAESAPEAPEPATKTAMAAPAPPRETAVTTYVAVAAALLLAGGGAWLLLR